MLKLFKIEGDMLVLDKDEIRLISEFRTILERDKGSKGDTQGRKKFRAFSEFAYIYHKKDILSIPNKEGYNKDKTHTFAIKESRLPEDWKIDKQIQEAIDKYKELQLDIPSLKILSSLKRGLSTSSEVVDIIVDKMQDTIKTLLSADIDGEDDWITNDEGQAVPNPNSTERKIEKLTKHLDRILAIAGKLPKTIDEIGKVTEKVKQEMEDGNVIRGNRQLGSREA